MTITIQVNHVDQDYAWAKCGNGIARKFTSVAAAVDFAARYGGKQVIDKVLKPCGNTVKFDPKAFHSVCPACGSVWQLDGDTAFSDGDSEAVQ